MTSLAHRIAGPFGATLASIDTGDTAGLSKRKGERRLKELGEELDNLQELLYAAGQHALLVVLQGLDTSGKDGAIRGVFDFVDPQGCRVQAFGPPTDLELGHDFLWRVHQKTPERGMIVVFNRSHYEDVVAVRVRELAPPEVWSARYEHINAFEKLLADNGTIIAKFYLHISREEQKERLLDREREVEKAWKLAAGDWVERRSWDDYIAAYEEVFRRCAAEHAPWYIVPADKKWFRNLAITEALVETLRPYRQGWLDSLRERGEQELEAVRKARTEEEAGG
jgi:PPK2 family polyphosphate:nucleotide phosphotransferase